MEDTHFSSLNEYVNLTGIFFPTGGGRGGFDCFLDQVQMFPIHSLHIKHSSSLPIFQLSLDIALSGYVTLYTLCCLKGQVAMETERI